MILEQTVYNIILIVYLCWLQLHHRINWFKAIRFKFGYIWYILYTYSSLFFFLLFFFFPYQPLLKTWCLMLLWIEMLYSPTPTVGVPPWCFSDVYAVFCCNNVHFCCITNDVSQEPTFFATLHQAELLLYDVVCLHDAPCLISLCFLSVVRNRTNRPECR